MPHTLFTYLTRITGGAYHERAHKRDPYVPAKRIHDLAARHVILRPQLLTGALSMNVTGTFSVPTVRKSGAPLAPTDIDHFSLHRNGVEINTLPVPAGPQVAWTDTTPLTGSDVYEVFTITKDGFISDPSNDLVIAVAAADPAAAITDLSGTLNTP